MDPQQAPLPPIELPPMRTFIVRRLHPLGRIDVVDEVVIHAHSWEPLSDDGAMFSTYYLKNGEPHKNARRAFYNIFEVEETTPIPVEEPTPSWLLTTTPPSRIIQ